MQLHGYAVLHQVAEHKVVEVNRGTSREENYQTFFLHSVEKVDEHCEFFGLVLHFSVEVDQV